MFADTPAHAHAQIDPSLFEDRRHSRSIRSCTYDAALCAPLSFITHPFSPTAQGVTGIVPTSAFPTSEPSQHVIIGGNGDSIYARLMTAIGRQDLVGERYANNAARVTHQAEIEGAISEWTSRYTVDEVLATMRKARVPAGRINDVAHLVADPHVQARGMVERVPFYSERLGKGWEIDMPGVSPVLERGGEGTRWAGRDLGEDNEAILGGELGVSQEEMQALREKGVI